MKLIARNNRMYTITDDISQVFWNAWETDKQSLKSQGYSIFKRDNNKIYLSHFEDTIATEEECIVFNKLLVDHAVDKLHELHQDMNEKVFIALKCKCQNIYDVSYYIYNIKDAFSIDDIAVLEDYIFDYKLSISDKLEFNS